MNGCRRCLARFHCFLIFFNPYVWDAVERFQEDLLAQFTHAFCSIEWNDQVNQSTVLVLGVDFLQVHLNIERLLPHANLPRLVLKVSLVPKRDRVFEVREVGSNELIIGLNLQTEKAIKVLKDWVWLLENCGGPGSLLVDWGKLEGLEDLFVAMLTVDPQGVGGLLVLLQVSGGLLDQGFGLEDDGGAC